MVSENMYAFLTTNQITEYRALHKKAKSAGNAKGADKIKALLLRNDGYVYEEIARILLIDDETVRRWENKWQTDSIEGLLSDNYKGSVSKLSIDQQDDVKCYIIKNWCLTTRKICNYIKSTHNCSYSPTGLVRLLHRMKFSYKKAKLFPGKADQEAQIKFIIGYDQLKFNKMADDKIYFMDGVHPTHNAMASYVWSEKGKEKYVETNTGRKRINLNGAYNAEDHQIILRNDESINAQSTIALLKQMLLAQPKGNLYVILDNAMYYRAKLVKEFLAQNTRIKFIHLPPYSPNLNLIERLWKFAKNKVMYCHYYEKFSDFKDAFMKLFENLSDYRDELATLMTDNFHLFPAKPCAPG